MTKHSKSYFNFTRNYPTFKHFTFKEFDCKSEPGSGRNMNFEFLKKLDNAREEAGIKFIISSGFRTKKYNDELIKQGYPASPNSSHLKGLAADIKFKSNADIYNILKALYSQKFSRIGISFKDKFIHVDVDTSKKQNTLWNY